LSRDPARLTAALEEYDRAIQIRPEYGDARLNRANLLRQLGRWKEAEQDLRELLKANPGDAAVHNNLGVVLIAQEKRDVAEREFAAALEADPGYAEAHVNLGQLLQQLGRQEEARPHFEEAVRLREQNARA